MRLVLIFLLLSFLSFGQSESEAVLKDTSYHHSVKKAVILSILPGAGQIYNHLAMPKGKKKAFWKVPLIYAGLGGTGYLLLTNQSMQRELKNEYSMRLDGLPASTKWAAYDDDGVLTLYNQYLNWRDLSILAVSAVYILQLVDAGVEAHFVDFDVSEDLSFNIDPVLMPNYSAGLKFSLKFR